MNNMPNFYSPTGNYEVWAEKPVGYFTDEEAKTAHPEWFPVPPVPPIPTLDEAKEAKLAELASERYTEEIGGVDWLRTADNVTYRLDTTDRGCLKLSNAREVAQALGSAYTPQLWKTDTGWFNATLEDFTAMGLAVAQHVQTCFNKEQTLAEQVKNASTVEEVNNINYL